MYSYEILPNLKRILRKNSKKDKELYERTLKKIDEIVSCYNVEAYKNLRNDLKDYKRVHIGSFVLVFKFIKDRNKIIFEDWDHRDKI